MTGSHLETSCQACHPGAISLEMLAAAPQACFDCHQEEDPHNGTLGKECASCHTPNSVPIQVFGEVLISRVTSRPLTPDEIEDRGR